MAADRTFFRSFPADADPAQLLNPDRQLTEPWGGHEHGPCDKCHGSGSLEYRCCSCLEAGSTPDCPACEGRVRFCGVCPACLGDGEIDDTVRRGIAVFPRREGLYRYLACKETADLGDKAVVELAGPLSEELDLDADQGALLIHPERIVAVEPLDPEVVEDIRRHDLHAA